jgi:hypothetical protein
MVNELIVKTIRNVAWSWPGSFASGGAAECQPSPERWSPLRAVLDDAPKALLAFDQDAT